MAEPPPGKPPAPEGYTYGPDGKLRVDRLAALRGLAQEEDTPARGPMVLPELVEHLEKYFGVESQLRTIQTQGADPSVSLFQRGRALGWSDVLTALKALIKDGTE